MCYSVCAGESLSLLVFFWFEISIISCSITCAAPNVDVLFVSLSILLWILFFFHLAHSILHSYWVIVRHFVKIVPYDESQCRRWILIFERFLTTQRICNVNTFHFFCHPIKYTPNSIPFIFLFLFLFSCQKSMHA